MELVGDLVERQLSRLRHLGIHVVDPDLLEIGRNDPAGLLTVGQVIIVIFGLLVRGLPVVTHLRLVQRDAKGFLFDQHMGLGDIDIDTLRVAVRTHDLLFEFHPFGDPFNTENICQDLDPVGPGILVLFSFPVPSVYELSCGFPLLCVCHGFSSHNLFHPSL